MPPTPLQVPAAAPRVRAFVHRGVVEASAILLDEALAGPLAVRRRAVAAWRPGVTVHRLDGGALVVRFPTPRWIDCARAPGLALVSTGPSPRAALGSAPLAPDEILALAPPDGAVLIVRGGVLTCTVPAAADIEDPAGYLDVARFAPIRVTALGPPPSPPRVVAAPTFVPARRLLGIADVPSQHAGVLEAIRAARRGVAPAADRGAGRPAFLAGLLATLSAFLTRAFSSRRTASAGTKPARALVVVSREPSRRGGGPSLFERFGAALRHLFASALVRANLAPFLGRRQAEYLSRMIDLFEQGELSEALRHAIPLGGDEGEDKVPPPPMLGVPTRRDQLAISGGGGGAAPALFTPEGFYEDLRRRYRAAFERLEQEGRIEEAAFVLAELLRESAEAVAFLERHGRLRLAAEIAESRGLPPALRVRQWLLAGDAARAVLLARRHGVFAEVVARLGQHPQGPVLRLLWAGTLADAGDFAAAVDVAWPLPEARATAQVWIDAAIAQGGGAAARMLARKLALVPEAFPDVRERALAILDEATGSPMERRALAEGLVDETPSPGARTLARAAIRALVRDGGRTGEPAHRLLVDRLEPLAADDPLRVDRPVWPTIVRAPLSQVGPPRSIAVAASDAGATPVHDAAHLPDGRTLLALGEAGVRVLGRGGRAAFDLDQPAHRLVVSDRGDRALALARRGDAWRVARLDLIGRRAEVWCEARFDRTAPDFDGSQWIVSDGARLLVVDALEQRFVALASFDLGESVSGVHAIARSPTTCVVAVDEPGVLLSRHRFELPSWTLRQRGPVQTPRRPTAAHSVFAAGAAGAVAILTRPAGSETSVDARAGSETSVDARAPLLVCSPGDCSLREALITGPGNARPVAAAVTPEWMACALASRDGVGVRLIGASSMTTRVDVTLGGAAEASLRLDGETLTVADDRGRVLVMELAQGAWLRDARV